MVSGHIETDDRAPVEVAAQGKLPDFIAVGPTRTGTTWLHQFLAGSVGLPKHVKETRFFDRDYALGLPSYLARFADCPPGLPIGEIAPTYFYNPQARERITRDVSHCKIICTLRDPVERLHSLYRLSVWSGRTTKTFEDSLESRWNSVVDECDYSQHTKKWQRAFGANRVLVVLFDDFLASPQRYVDQICDFIGISRIPVGDAPVSPDDTVYAMQRVPRGTLFAKLFRWFFRLGHDQPDQFEVFLHWLRQHGIDSAARRVMRSPLGNVIRTVIYKDMPSLKPETEAYLRTALIPQIESLEALIHRDLSAWKNSGSVSAKKACDVPKKRHQETAGGNSPIRIGAQRGG